MHECENDDKNNMPTNDNYNNDNKDNFLKLSQSFKSAYLFLFEFCLFNVRPNHKCSQYCK